MPAGKSISGFENKEIESITGDENEEIFLTNGKENDKKAVVRGSIADEEVFEEDDEVSESEFHWKTVTE